MRITLVLAALAALLVLASPATAKVKKLEASMKGSNEMPAADPDGSGTAKLRLDAAKKRVCFTIKVKKIDDVVAAHIHAGKKSVASGSIVVDLITAPKSGSTFTGCTKGVAKKLIRKILKHPGSYYVNVHTTDFPGGAVRGQLHKP
jgi:CHRD domain-containing protein